MSSMRRDELNRKVYGWLVRDGNAAVGCSSMWADTMGGEYYCDNLLWQLCRTYHHPWWHYLGSTCIVKTSQTIVATLLRSTIDQNDSIIIVDITGRTRDGWLPQKAWDWIRDNNG